MEISSPLHTFSLRKFNRNALLSNSEGNLYTYIKKERKRELKREGEGARKKKEKEKKFQEQLTMKSMNIKMYQQYF